MAQPIGGYLDSLQSPPRGGTHTQAAVTPPIYPVSNLFGCAPPGVSPRCSESRCPRSGQCSVAPHAPGRLRWTQTQTHGGSWGTTLSDYLGHPTALMGIDHCVP